MNNIFLVTDSLKKNGWGEFVASTAVILAYDRKKTIFILSRSVNERAFPENVKVLWLTGNVYLDTLLLNAYNIIFKPYVIHFCSEKVFEICNFFSHDNIVQTIHGTYGYLFTNEFSKFKHKIKKFTFDSEYTKKLYEDLFNLTSSWILYPLSVFYLDNEHNSTYEKKRNNILFIGNSKKRKGLEILLNAFENIKERYQEVNLVLIGNFSDFHNIQFYGDSRIHVLSNISNEELKNIISTSLINVLPSMNVSDEGILHFEGFGLVHIESNILGTPTIGSLECGNTDIITDNINGFLIEQGDSDDLANALSKVIDCYMDGDYSLNKNSLLVRNKFSSNDFRYNLNLIYNHEI